MKKLLVIIVAMVLLSGAAWGQPKDVLIVGGKIKSGVTINASDQTAWETKEPQMWPEKIPFIMSNGKHEPWADSRYRLEKNEVTGRYRITERVQRPKEGTPQGVINEWVEIINDQTYDCPNWSNCPLSLCERWPEERLIKYLGKLRAKEQADKAWRPIR